MTLNRTGGDVPPLTAHTYLPQTLAALWENLPQVLLGAILLSLAGAPAFVLAVLGLPWLALVAALLTQAPAWTALLRLEAKWVAGHTASVAELVPAFRGCWVRSVRMALVAVGPGAVVAVGAGRLAAASPDLAFWTGVIGGALGLVIFIVVLLYAFPLVALRDMEAGSALRYAFILSAQHIVNTMGLAGMAVLLLLATVYVSAGLLVLWPALYGVFVVNNCRLALAGSAHGEAPA